MRAFLTGLWGEETQVCFGKVTRGKGRSGSHVSAGIAEAGFILVVPLVTSALPCTLYVPAVLGLSSFCTPFNPAAPKPGTLPAVINPELCACCWAGSITCHCLCTDGWNKTTPFLSCWSKKTKNVFEALGTMVWCVLRRSGVPPKFLMCCEYRSGQPVGSVAVC